jgi:hypothetical protein
MFSIGGMIDHPIRDMVLVLSITFMVPLIGAIAGTIAAKLTGLQAWRKGTGRQNG